MKKKIFAACLVICLLATAVIGSTLAYFTDKKEVTNTFTVGKVAITLDETDVDLYGVKDGEDRVDKNDYKLIPGHEYTKDPTIHVAKGSEPCYVFVEINNGIADYIDELVLTGWTQATADNGKTYYYQANSVDATVKAQDVDVFKSFTVKEDVDLAGADGKTIVVTAYAVQKDGFNSAEEAFNATFGANK